MRSDFLLLVSTICYLCSASLQTPSPSRTELTFGDWKLEKTSRHLEPRGGKTVLSLNETKHAEELAEQFYTQLKSFISDSDFDGVRFKASVHNLHRNLSNILRSTRPQIYTNKPLFYQYNQVICMFEAMVEASDALEYYSSMDNTEGYLIRRMIELNIGISALFNSHGVLDLKASENIDQIFVYWNLYSAWRHSFQSLSGVSEDNRLFFQYKASEAEATIRILWAQVETGEVQKILEVAA